MSEHWNQVYETREPDQVQLVRARTRHLPRALRPARRHARRSASSTWARARRSRANDCARGVTRRHAPGHLGLGTRPGGLARPGLDDVTTVEADVTTWEPPRRYDVWHDRAVLHFLDAARARRYVDHAATRRSRRAASSSSASSRPTDPRRARDWTSPVTAPRNSASSSATDFVIVAERREVHRTPWGNPQSFQWIAARRRASA